MVVAKRMAFFSQAVGNAALTGVAIGVIIGESYTAPYVSMFSFCLLFGLVLNFTRNRTKMSADTLIGVFLSISLAIGATALLWVSAKVNTHILDTVMFGSILTVNDTDMSVLLVTTLLTAVTALPLFNHMLLASLNPSLAHVRGVRVHLLEYVFVLLLTILTVACVKIVGAVLVEALLLIPAAAARNLNRSMRGFVLSSIAFSTRELPRRHLRADALGSAVAVGRRDHPRGGRDLRRDDGRSAWRCRAIARRAYDDARNLVSAVVAVAWRSLRRWRRAAAGRRASRSCSRARRRRTRSTLALTAGTPIRVHNVPADGRQLSLLKDYIARRMDGARADVRRGHGRRYADERAARRPAVPLRARRQHPHRRHRRRPCRGRSMRPASRSPTRRRRTCAWGSDTDRRRDGRRAVFLAQRLERDPHGRHHRARSRGAVSGFGRRDRDQPRRR